MELDDKCFHPSAASLSVSLLVRSETGSALAPRQRGKLFREGSKDRKNGQQASQKNFEKCQLNAICHPLGQKTSEDVCFHKSFQQLHQVFFLLFH